MCYRHEYSKWDRCENIYRNFIIIMLMIIKKKLLKITIKLRMFVNFYLSSALVNLLKMCISHLWYIEIYTQFVVPSLQEGFRNNPIFPTLNLRYKCAIGQEIAKDQAKFFIKIWICWSFDLKPSKLVHFTKLKIVHIRKLFRVQRRLDVDDVISL